MKRIIAQARKELTQTMRDRLTLVLALVLPLALAALGAFFFVSAWKKMRDMQVEA